MGRSGRTPRYKEGLSSSAWRACVSVCHCSGSADCLCVCVRVRGGGEAAQGRAGPGRDGARPPRPAPPPPPPPPPPASPPEPLPALPPPPAACRSAGGRRGPAMGDNDSPGYEALAQLKAAAGKANKAVEEGIAATSDAVKRTTARARDEYHQASSRAQVAPSPLRRLVVARLRCCFYARLEH